jgi:hypothetical protein
LIPKRLIVDPEANEFDPASKSMLVMAAVERHKSTLRSTPGALGLSALAEAVRIVL